MFWLRNKKIIFSYTLLSGGLSSIIIIMCLGQKRRNKLIFCIVGTKIIFRSVGQHSRFSHGGGGLRFSHTLSIVVEVFRLKPGLLALWPIAQSVTCSTADPGLKRLIPAWSHTFLVDWSWNNFYSHFPPFANSNKVIVKHRYVHEVLVNRLDFVWFDSLRPSQQYFSDVGMGLPELNQY